MQKKRRIGAAKIPVTLSALAALGIILGKFFAINITEFMRFSFENTTILFAGIVFGPMLGGAVGAVQDIVGCLAVGYNINPIITLGCASIGVISGIVFRLFKKAPLSLRIASATILSHIVGSLIIKTIGLSIFYNAPFAVTLLWRILNYSIVGTLEVILLCILLKSKQLLSQINKTVPFYTTQKFKSGSEASDYAKSVSGVFSKPGLDRVMALLDALGSPEKSVKIVHITGTNGKGSTSAMLTSILKHSGLKVGSFNSPYLIEMREAIRINGEPISEERLLSLFDRLRPIADEREDKPTEFELLTAAAYLAFKEENVDLAVIECGMGAKRDATNVIDSPLISVITGISVDHTSYLGTSTAEIAEEKSGVIKRTSPLIIGNLDGEALEVITKKANDLNAPIYSADTPVIKSFSLEGTIIDVGDINDIRLPLLGAHQPKNASIAIAAAKLLSPCFPTITDDSIREGIVNTVWRARFEIVKTDPILIFDGAHNLEGIRSAVESARSYFTDKVICVSGVLKDKEYEEMADEIATIADTVVTVTPDNPRALDAATYASVLTNRVNNVYHSDSVSDGVAKALDLAKETSKPIICLGSLYLYKDVLAALK